MTQLQQYVACVIAAAFLCGILKGITKSSFASDSIRFLCGLVMAVVILRPLNRIDLAEWNTSLDEILQESENCAASGVQMYEQAVGERIIAGAEEYIMDKAAQWDSAVIPEVSLDEQMHPFSVILHGDIPPLAKDAISSILETDLGITKENQQWIG